jgi:hypothetical protein
MTAAASLLLLLLPGVAHTADVDSSGAKKAAASTSSFLRLTRDAQQSPVALETAIVRDCAPRGPSGLVVTLIGVLHIGEKSYYAQLNRELASYDTVLYELVAPPNRKVPKAGESSGNNPLSLAQNGMKDLLGLEFQLNAIDYTGKNMVHADMSPDEFARSMEERGESLMTMFMRMMGYAMARQSQTSDALSGGRLLMALLDKNRALALKRVMAEQFVENDDSLAALEGPQGSTLIAGRNQVVIKTLRKQIAAGKRKIAIFYGAGHMPDLQKRLHDAFGLDAAGTRWLVAWDLKSAPTAAKPHTH